MSAVVRINARRVCHSGSVDSFAVAEPAGAVRVAECEPVFYLQQHRLDGVLTTLNNELLP